MKSYTPPMTTLRRLAKVRKKLRHQLKDLTYAQEFYINNKKEYLEKELSRVRHSIAHVRGELRYPSLY